MLLKQRPCAISLDLYQHYDFDPVQSSESDSGHNPQALQNTYLLRPLLQMFVACSDACFDGRLRTIFHAEPPNSTAGAASEMLGQSRAGVAPIFLTLKGDLSR